MTTKKTQTLEERLAEKKIVNFDRGLIESLDESTIRELVENFVEHPQQSVGQRFVAAMESIYRKPVVAEGDNGIDVDVTTKEIIAVIGGGTTASNGVITVGRRSDKRVLYLRWSSQLKAGDEVHIRDPFTRAGILEKYVEAGEVKFIGSEPYDAQVADGDGHLVVEQDLYVLLILSWQTSEASPVALTEVNRRLLESETVGKELKASDVAGYFPRAHDKLVQIKGEKRGREWQRFVDNLMDSSEAPSGGTPPPFGSGGSSIGDYIDPAPWWSMNFSDRSRLINLAGMLSVFDTIQGRMSVFAFHPDLGRFRSTIGATDNSDQFVTTLFARFTPGQYYLTEEEEKRFTLGHLLGFIATQQDLSESWKNFFSGGQQGGDEVRGSKFNFGGADLRGAQVNIQSNVFGGRQGK